MNEVDISVRLIVALALGAAIGLEREVNAKDSLDENMNFTATLGLRTFAITAILGSIAGLLAPHFIALSAVLTGGFIILLQLYYFLSHSKTKEFGITTELSLLFSFTIGLLTVLNVLPIELSVAMTAVAIVLLSRKEKIKRVSRTIKGHELNAFTAFAIIALVILPFLPDTSFTISNIPILKSIADSFGAGDSFLTQIELINPFKLWLIVALITGIDVIGYILERTLGKSKGYLMASIAGGFISSTATTQSLAQESQHTRGTNTLVGAALFANMASFIPVIALVAPINAAFFIRILPTILILIIASGLIGFYFIRKGDGKHKHDTEKTTHETQIFNLVPALKFAGFFLVIRFVAKVATELFGRAGFLTASAIAATTGIDAAVISTAELTGTTIDIHTGVLAFILINAVNLLSKTVYSFMQGTREFSVKLGISMIIIIAASMIGLLFV